MRTLVTGGVRSGKSAHAESLLAAAPAVAYIAPGPRYDDADWADRIAAHQRRRPAHWTTVEDTDLPRALAGVSGDAVLVDCLGTWLTARFDDLDLWERRDWQQPFGEMLEAALAAVRGHGGDLVVVTNEVGLGVVPEHRSGRVFRDALGWTNQRFAEIFDDVTLVISGRTLAL
ncbi:adenosylcobinamide kinase/adenosylcobinamide phosphate guanyltransferase [Aeromicrobium sp. PE09-221]|uniref:bifunctional adenosylcobinamide kinase/adenosylcobinamide-phosphate guanylyltransferase n=1 Tax=Aeromicrobium sp. PE09-221 TaxID=1898043 RepID=UPI000B3E6E2E|nr:bifunctional adenosylcobinamide kinase/adenosylcobinamide-phosphate guanylyltransferase [Aeromicrobium sp. PE09-221]OUZ07577.1 adenosylcobinamide kinase/adenosylcobinamide phosphate guanyltransferase [Aeromicrobium sp. PE09-221]